MNTELSKSQLEEVRVAFEQISGLPLCIHITDVEGRFLFANKDARKLFSLGDGPFQHQISDYYEDHKERSYILRELRKAPAGQWLKGFRALLHIQGDRVNVKFSSKPFFDEKGEIYAILTMMESMRRVEWYADLEDELEVGLFVIDRQLKIADCNQFLADMLGFESASDLKGKLATQFLWEPESATHLLKALLDTPKLRKYPMKLKRKNSSMVLIELNCDAISLEHGEISRVRGIVKDTTFKVFYDDLPVGLFLINSSPSGKDIISQANLTFAKIHGFEKVEDVLGKPSDIFRTSQVAFDAYKGELNKAEKLNRPLLDYYMEILDNFGKKRNVVLNVKFIPGHGGKIRVGAIYDLTNDISKNIRTLDKDFSALLHTYIATVHQLGDTLRMLIKAHGYDVYTKENNVNRSIATSIISGHKIQLGALLSDLEKIANKQNIGIDIIESIQKPWKRISENKFEGERDNAAWIRRNMIELRNVLELLRHKNLPKELLNNIRAELDEILRLTTVLSLSYSLDVLNERIPELYYFRDYLRGRDTEFQDAKPQRLLPIIQDAIQFLEEFSSIHKVVIVQHLNPSETILVNCNKTTLNRAFHSLLHNAIKYSWGILNDFQPQVDVRIEKKRHNVEITIENWGIPIRQEELENDEIFNFGKRGREADDRGRSGTGIGLYDARNIIEKHGGTLRITSEPSFGNPPDQYLNPFITKVFITLPIVVQP